MSAVIDGFVLDVMVSEEHSFDSMVTRHPVEKGADVTDHIRDEPITVRVEGLVTDTPIGTMTSVRGPNDLPSDDAFNRLLAIRAAKRPVTIETSLRRYENMGLERFSVPKDKDTGDALRFSAFFVQLELVTNERTTVRVSIPRGQRKVNRGNKAAEPAPDVAPSPPAKVNAAASDLRVRFPGSS